MRRSTIFDGQVKAALTGEPQTAEEIAAKCKVPPAVVERVLYAGLPLLRRSYDGSGVTRYHLDLRLQETSE